MRRVLLFIFPILIVVAGVFTAYGVFQVRSEEEKLWDDLRRKARAIAEGMDLSVRQILLTNDAKSAEYVVNKFQFRERLQGGVIYDKAGNIFAVTPRFEEWHKQDKSRVLEVLATRMPHGGLEKFNELTLFSYLSPVMDEENRLLGAIEIIHETSYVFSYLNEIWKRICISLATLIVLIILVVSLLQRQLFLVPIRQLTQWFSHFQKGEIDEMHSFKGKDEFGKLANEVEQVALSLRVARKAATQEAQHRIQHDDLWTEAKLKNLVQAKLGENALFVVSNREPYMHVLDKSLGKVKCMRPASGVVTAIDPILRACGGMWVAQASGDADKKFVNSRDKLGVPPEDNRYILKRVWLSKEEEEGYYYGFANEGLWPLCHITHTRPIFRESDWEMYKQANRKFARAVINELPKKPAFVFVQDYHFTLLAQMIKEERPDTTVALFWHIPWPNPEVFSICPYQREILEGMLYCDLIGFHVQFHCNNFLETVNRLLECRVDTEKFSVVRDKRESFIRSYPISVDSSMKDRMDTATPLQIEKIKRELGLEDKIVALGVERIDYTKGIVERILAIDRFLGKYPQYKDKFAFVQLAAPSRTHIKRYHDLISEIDELVERINWKHSNGTAKPIIYLKRHFSIEEIGPFYALADIGVVSSLHDGMNLVAKEYVSFKDDLNGVLILSCFTGAARELTDAVQINPYSTEEFADSFKKAIEMPVEEKKQRMLNMRKIISENNIYRWAGNIISDLTALKKS